MPQNTMKYYYVHKATQRVQWEEPTDAPAAENIPVSPQPADKASAIARVKRYHSSICFMMSYSPSPSINYQAKFKFENAQAAPGHGRTLVRVAAIILLKHSLNLKDSTLLDDTVTRAPQQRGHPASCGQQAQRQSDQPARVPHGPSSSSRGTGGWCGGGICRRCWCPVRLSLSSQPTSG